MQTRLFAWLRDFCAQYRMPSAIPRNHLKTDSKIRFFFSFFISIVINSRTFAKNEKAGKENKENVGKFESSRRSYEQSMKSKLKTFVICGQKSNNT